MLERHVARGVGLFACFGAGILFAVTLAGCGGGGGGVAGAISTTGGRDSGTRSDVTQTREAVVLPTRSTATDTPTQSVATVTETQPVTETRPGAITVTHSTTVGVTVSGSVQAPPQTTVVESAAATDTTPAWVWVLIAIGAGLVIGLIVWLFRRGSTGKEREEQQRLVSATVSGWAAQGWAIESQTESSAVLRQNGERLLVSVEADGRISSTRLGAPSEPLG